MRWKIGAKQQLIYGFGLFLLSTFTLSAIEDSVQRQVNQLITDKKYLSSWRYIERLDAQNLDPDLVIKKADILLHGALRATDINQFYLRDGNGEVPFNPNGEGAVAIKYPLQQTLQDAVASWPKNPAIWAQLGAFYYAVFRNPNATNDQLDTFADSALSAYLQAVENGLNDPLILNRIGILYTWREDLEQAVNFLRSALEQQEKNPEIQYDLAYALFLKGEGANALPYAQYARDTIKSGPGHYNALLLCADIQLGLQNISQALAVYEELVGLDPTNTYPVRRTIECYLIMGDTRNLEKYTRMYIEANPGDATSFYRLTNLFLQYQKPGLLISIARNLKAKYARSKPEMTGLMSFYEAMLYAGNNQSKEALAALADAKKQLSGIYSDTHPITQQIRDLNQRLRQ